MAIRSRSAQTISIDVYIAVAIFLSAIILFYSFVSLQGVDNDIAKQSQDTGININKEDLFRNGTLTAEGESILVGMDCSQLRQVFGAINDICIYFHDGEGNVVPIGNGTHLKYGVGCSGVKVGGVECGKNIT